jgi:hypothetical protein
VVLEFRWSCAAADRIKIEEEKAEPLQTIKWLYSARCYLINSF